MWIQRMVGERIVEVESACKGLYVWIGEVDVGCELGGDTVHRQIGVYKIEKLFSVMKQNRTGTPVFEHRYGRGYPHL
jgi:hypothetical protein